jgi:hypothetical protein
MRSTDCNYFGQGRIRKRGKTRKRNNRKYEWAHRLTHSFGPLQLV